MSGTSQTSNNQVNVFPHSFGLLPPEGPRSVRVAYNWASATVLTFTEDFGQMMATGKMSMVQSMFVDNSANAYPVTMYVLGTQQTIVIPAQSQGVYPVYFTGDPLFTVSCATSSSVTTAFHFHNIPQPMLVWIAATGGGTAVTAAQGAPNTEANAWPVAGYYHSAGVTVTDGARSALQVTSGGAVLVSDATLDKAAGSSVPATKPAGSLVGAGVYTLAGVTLTDGQSAPLQSTSAGALISQDANLATMKTTATPATVPAAGVLTSGVYRSAGVTLTDGQAVPIQMDNTAATRVYDYQLLAAIGSVSPATNNTKMVGVGGVYTSAGVTLTTGQSAMIQLDAAAKQLVNAGFVFDTSNQITVNPVPVVNSYSACIPNLTTVAAATDVMTITGAAGKTIEIVSITISGATSAAAGCFPYLIKRSTLDTGGTSTTTTPVPYASTQAAASAVVAFYTANPASLGTSVGFVAGTQIQFPAFNGVTQPYTFDFTKAGMSGVQLKSATEQLALNLNNIATSTALSITIAWRER